MKRLMLMFFIPLLALGFSPGSVARAFEIIPVDIADLDAAEGHAPRCRDDAPERAALVDLYHSTAGEEWHAADNWLSETVHHCDGWYGVYCDEKGHVSRIDLTANNLRGVVPVAFGNLKWLQCLDLSFNHLTALPASIDTLDALWRLNLGSNQLADLPGSFGGLAGLRELCLFDNQLTSLPDSFVDLADLRYLYLYGNQLTSLPQDIGNLSQLQGLHLYDNQLSSIPDSFVELAALQYLYLQDNRITALPASFGDLSELVYVDLIDNRLVELPESMVALSNMQHLYVHDNPIACLPEAVDSWYQTIRTRSPYGYDICPAEPVDLARDSEQVQPAARFGDTGTHAAQRRESYW